MDVDKVSLAWRTQLKRVILNRQRVMTQQELDPLEVAAEILDDWTVVNVVIQADRREVVVLVPVVRIIVDVLVICPDIQHYMRILVHEVNRVSLKK